MATTLQSLRFPFYPSITPPNSHTYPSSTVHYTPKSNTFNSSFIGTRNKRVLSSRALNSEYSPTVAENLGDVSIFTAAGESVMFKDLWDQEQVRMLMFVQQSFDFYSLYVLGTSQVFLFFQLTLWFLLSGMLD